MYDVESGDMWSKWSGGNVDANIVDNTQPQPNYNIYNIDNTRMQYVPGVNTSSDDSGGNVVIAGNTSSPQNNNEGLIDSIMGNVKFGYNQGNTPPQIYQQTSGGGGGKSMGGGGSASGNWGTTQTTSYFSNKALPSYQHPLYDYNRINLIAQQQAAPQLSKLEHGLYAGMSKINATDNPYMQRQARKELLQGYGGGISQIMGGATKTGQELYNQEYAGLMASAQAMFQAALADYNKSFTQTTVSTPNPDPGPTNGQSFADWVFGVPAGRVVNPMYAPGSDWERRVKEQLGGGK